MGIILAVFNKDGKALAEIKLLIILQINGAIMCADNISKNDDIPIKSGFLLTLSLIRTL
jgi:hypothetical protein